MQVCFCNSYFYLFSRIISSAVSIDTIQKEIIENRAISALNRVCCTLGLEWLYKVFPISSAFVADRVIVAYPRHRVVMREDNLTC